MIEKKHEGWKEQAWQGKVRLTYHPNKKRKREEDEDREEADKEKEDGEAVHQGTRKSKHKKPRLVCLENPERHGDDDCYFCKICKIFVGSDMPDKEQVTNCRYCEDFFCGACILAHPFTAKQVSGGSYGHDGLIICPDCRVIDGLQNLDQVKALLTRCKEATATLENESDFTYKSVFPLKVWHELDHTLANSSRRLEDST